MSRNPKLLILFLATLLAAPSLAVGQDQDPQEATAKRFRIRGQAIGPDSRPGGHLRVGLAYAPKQLIAEKQRLIPFAESVTDAEGRFVIEFEAPLSNVLFVHIGDRRRTAWTSKPLRLEGKDLDLGVVRLRDRLLMPENEALEAPVQIRGTAIAQSGEPAGEVPIVVKNPQGISPWPDDLTLADGRTAADGTFVLEFDAGDAKVVQLDFGRKGEANWLIVPVSVEAAEVDLQDVRLHPPVKSALDRDGGVKGAATFTIHGIALDANGSPASDLLVVVKVPNKMLVSANDDPRDGLAAEAEVRPGDHGKRNAVSPPWFAAIGIGMTEPDGSFIVTLSVPNSDAVQVEIGDKWKTAWLIRPVRATDGDQGLGTVRLLPPIADK